MVRNVQVILMSIIIYICIIDITLLGWAWATPTLGSWWRIVCTYIYICIVRDSVCSIKTANEFQFLVNYTVRVWKWIEKRRCSAGENTRRLNRCRSHICLLLHSWHIKLIPILLLPDYTCLWPHTLGLAPQCLSFSSSMFVK